MKSLWCTALHNIVSESEPILHRTMNLHHKIFSSKTRHFGRSSTTNVYSTININSTINAYSTINIYSTTNFYSTININSTINIYNTIHIYL